MAFQSFHFELTSWKLFQKRIMRTKFDIYVFIYFFAIKPDQSRSIHNCADDIIGG